MKDIKAKEVEKKNNFVSNSIAKEKDNTLFNMVKKDVEEETEKSENTEKSEKNDLLSTTKKTLFNESKDSRNTEMLENVETTKNKDSIFGSKPSESNKKSKLC